VVAKQVVDLAIPDEVVRMNLTAHGEAGPDLAGGAFGDRRRASGANSVIGDAFEGGCVGFVAAAERSDGTPTLLKLSFRRLVPIESRQEGLPNESGERLNVRMEQSSAPSPSSCRVERRRPA
jgi:hypothetical protein